MKTATKTEDIIDQVKTIRAYAGNGEDAVTVAHDCAKANSFNYGVALTVDDSNPLAVTISDYEKVLAVVLQA